MIKIPYEQAMKFDFQQAMQKLATESSGGDTRYKIKKIYASLKKARETIAAEYKKDVMELFAKRDEEGKFDQETFECAEGKEKEFEKAQEEFGKREVVIPYKKLISQEIKNMKLSAIDELALEPILDDSDAEDMDANVLKLGGGRK